MSLKVLVIDDVLPSQEAFSSAGLVIDYSKSVELPSTAPLYPLVARLRDRAIEIKSILQKEIKALSNRTMRGSTLLDLLRLEEGNSYFWSTLLGETSPYKLECLQDLYKIILIDLELPKEGELELYSNNRALVIALESICKKHGVEFQHFGERKVQQRSLYRRFKSDILGTLVSFVLKEMRKCCQNKKKKSFHGSDCAVITYFPPAKNVSGRIQSNYYTGLEPELERFNFHWLLMYADKAGNYASHRGELEECARVHFQDDYLGFTGLLKTLRKYLRMKFRIKWLEDRKDLCWLFEIDFSGYLRDSWRESFSFHLIEYLAHEVRFENFFALHPDLKTVLYLMEGQPWEQAMLSRRKSSRFIGLIHSTIREQQLNYFVPDQAQAHLKPDYAAFNGENSLRPLLNQGYEKSRLIPVEAQRYLYLDQYLKRDYQPSNKKPSTLLVASSVDVKETRVQLQLLKESGAWENFSRRIFKPHPHLKGLSLEREFPDLKLEATTEPMEDLLSERPVLFVSNTSSVIVEALYADCKVVSYLLINQFAMLAVQKHRHLKVIASPQELKEALEEFQSQQDRGLFRGYEDLGDFFYLDASLPRWKDFLREFGGSRQD